jgi:predicted Zn finger-like uncharacterized protein
LVIRCERCSTLYELDEALLSPEGSPVQCTRCNHVFTARPPGASGQAMGTVPPTPEPAAREPAGSETGMPEPATPTEPLDASAPSPAPAAAVSAPEAAPATSAAAGTRPTSAGAARPTAPRSGPAVYRPSPSPAVPGASRPPTLRRDTLGTFESRLRWSARWKWLAPAIVLVLAALAVAAWLFLSRRSDPEADRLRAEALGLVALDDAASLDTAARKLGEVVERSPRLREAEADRALAQLLRAAALVDAGETLAARIAARGAERDRLRRDMPAAWEERERAVSAELDALGAQVRSREEQGRALTRAAVDVLTRLGADGRSPAEVGRALATYHALAGDRQRLEGVANLERGAQDPWTALARASLDARAPEPPARERAAAALGEIAAQHPEMLRARFLLARTQAGLGRHSEAIAILDGLLAANPRHERAQILRGELTALLAAPAPPPVEPQSTAAAPEKPALLPRKPVAQPGTALTAPTPRPIRPAPGTPAQAGGSGLPPASAPAAASPPGTSAEGASATPPSSGGGPLTPGAAPWPGAPPPGPGSAGATPRPTTRRAPVPEPHLGSSGG